MNARQSRADKDTAATLLAIPESMRPIEARLWLESHGYGSSPSPAKVAAIKVTKTEPYVPPVQAPRSDLAPATRSWSRPEQPQTPVPSPERQSTYIGPGWRMNFATRTMERVRS